jgi:hypothetical protein
LWEISLHSGSIHPVLESYSVCVIRGNLDWLIIYCFTFRSRIFHLYGDVTITGEGLQNLGLCSALRAFEQGGIFIVPHLLWHGASVFPVSSAGPPHLIASYDSQGDAEDLFLPGPSREWRSGISPQYHTRYSDLSTAEWSVNRGQLLCGARSRLAYIFTCFILNRNVFWNVDWWSGVGWNKLSFHVKWFNLLKYKHYNLPFCVRKFTPF